MNKYDIVIPVGLNEIPIINNIIYLVKKNVIGYNKIFLISSDKNLNIDGCITIDEKKFSFNKEDIEKIVGPSPRIGWIYQQLLKLYALKEIGRAHV